MDTKMSKKQIRGILVSGVALVSVIFMVVLTSGCSNDVLLPKNGFVEIPIAKVNDGKAHFFKVKADDGITVKFFTLKSNDGVVRAAVDSCDVCYQSGKGYHQEGDYMVCDNCGQKFVSNLINVLRGGCNPAPLDRKIVKDKLVISMKDINTNSWYCKFKV